MIIATITILIALAIFYVVVAYLTYLWSRRQEKRNLRRYLSTLKETTPAHRFHDYAEQCWAGPTIGGALRTTEWALWVVLVGSLAAVTVWGAL